jgi:hypothetical protein
MSDPAARATSDLIVLALDELVQLVIDAGVVCTRDPGEFQPPGAIVAAPTISGAATMQSIAISVPVYIVSDQPGGAAGLEWMLEAVALLLPVFGETSATPAQWVSPINPAGLPAYLITATLNVSTS